MSIVSEQEFDGIIRSVCEVYRITPKLLLGRKRWQPVAEARQMAMAILRARGISSQQAGRMFNRDHATILHAVKVTADRVQVDRLTRARWKVLKHLAVEPLPGAAWDAAMKMHELARDAELKRKNDYFEGGLQ